MHESVVIEIVRCQESWEVRSRAGGVVSVHTDIGLALDAATALADHRPLQILVRENAQAPATRNLLGDVA